MEKTWYNKLKEGGFRDIEDTQTEERLLKEWDFNFFRNQFDLIQYESTVEYYERAKQLLFSYSFKDGIQKRIWELHCEGYSERAIVSKVRKYKKSMVHYIIAHIAKQIKD